MYEYGTLKPVEVTLRREWSRCENNGGDEPNLGIIYVYVDISQGNTI
jgi:hypothetical protein